MKRIYICLLLPGLLIGCSKQAQVASFEQTFIEHIRDTCYCKIEVEYQYFESFPGDKSIMKALNAEFAHLAFGQYDQELYIPMNHYGRRIPLTQSLPGDWYGISTENAVDRYRALLRDSYSFTNPDASPNWYFYIEAHLGGRFKNLQSYYVLEGCCPGSASEYDEERGFVFDVNTGRKVSLYEIIPIENQDELTRRIKARDLEKGNYGYAEPGYFNVSEDGITFFQHIYDPDREWSVLLSWEEIDDIVDKSVFTTSPGRMDIFRNQSKRLLEHYFDPREEGLDWKKTSLDVDIAYFDNESKNKRLAGRINESIDTMLFSIPDLAEIYDLESNSPVVSSFTERMNHLQPENTAPLYYEAIVEMYQRHPEDYDIMDYGINAGFGPRYKKWQNYVGVFSVFTGGNHVHQMCKTLLIDMEDGKIVSLEDIIPAANQAEVLSLLKDVLKEEAGTEAECYHVDRLEDVFFLTADGITWLYLGTYPADYYADLFIPWNKLKGLVKSEFLP